MSTGRGILAKNSKKGDIDNAEDIVRLRMATRNDMQQWRQSLLIRLKFLRELVGTNYAQNGAANMVPLNMIELMTSIFTQNLCPSNPQCLITTQFPELRPEADTLSKVINQVASDIGMSATFMAGFRESLFSLGIFKVGMAASAFEEADNAQVFNGEYFITQIQPEDILFDAGADSFESCNYIAHRSRVPKNFALESGLYDKECIENAPAISRLWQTNAVDRANQVYANTRVYNQDYYEYIDLWEVYLPFENRVVTFVGNANTAEQFLGKVVRDEEYVGPRGGPFVFLCYNKVPGNVMPLPPVATVYDLHVQINQNYRKLIRQGLRSKSIGLAMAGTDGDVKQITSASDGVVVKVSTPSVEERKFGAIDQQLFALTLDMINRFSIMCGNLDILGGLAPQADTLGQEKILSSNASIRMLAMKQAIRDALRQIFTKLGFYVHNDPVSQFRVLKEAPGGVSIPAFITPENKQGAYDQYNYTVNPYSLEEDTPEKKASKMMQLIQLAMPNQAQMAESGVVMNWPYIMRTLGKYVGLDETDGMFSFADPNKESPSQGGEAQSAPPKSPSGPRVYTHQNVSRNTQGSRDAEVLQVMQSMSKAGVA